MANIKSVINMHNKEVITEKKTQAVNRDCINRPDFSLSNHCQITNIIYKQKLHQIFKTVMEKFTTEPAKVHLNSDMETIRNHSIMKNIRHIPSFRRSTRDLKNSKHNLKYNFIF